MKRRCYFNGKIMDLEKACVSPYDLGMMRGYGVFDVMCTQNGKPFLFEYHWRRLVMSARELNMNLPIKKQKFKKVVEKLLKDNGYKKSIIRTVLTGGVTSDGFTLERGKETFYIIIEKFIPLPKKIFDKGAEVVTLEYKRHLPYLKVTNYVLALKNQDLKKKSKALEMIYVKNGNVYEATTSNVFMFKNGKLITPKDDVLLGTTRKLVLKLAEKEGVRVFKKPIKLKELLKADEVFLTAANKDIAPVIKIDGKKIGNGEVGENTKTLMRAFEEFVEKY